jgi:tetratricopeptide (TPR) repeat protein
MISVPQALALAWQEYQAGQWQRAELILRQILQADASQVDALHLLGIIALQTGRAALAIDLLQAVVGLNPSFVEAHNNLGMALQAQGRFAEAVLSHQQSLHLRPAFAEAHSNLGRAFQLQGKLAEAEQSYEQALRLRPDYAESHYNLATALQQQSKLAEALSHLKYALQLRPDFAEARQTLATYLQQQGQWAEAAACWEEAVRLWPNSAEAHFHLGMALQQQGKPAEAEVSFETAVRLKPNFVEAISNLGSAFQAQKKLPEAVACFQQALRIRPDSPELHFNLGCALQMERRLAEAAASYRQAVRLNPNYVEAHNNLGNALREQGQLAEALVHLEYGLRLYPESGEGHMNLGVVLQDQGKLIEAAHHLEQALRLCPDSAEAHYNHGLFLLLQGNFEQGWREHEWRLLMKGHAPPLSPGPKWDGGPLDGKTILLYAEQGRGDILQFIRYAALVKKRGATVLVECRPAMLGLLAGCPGIDRLVPEGEPLPAYDVQAALLSLPALCGTMLATIPAEVPYLFADSSRVAFWKERLASSSGFKVGICWQGNPAHKHDQRRSVPLAQFAPLAEIAELRLVSLQKGPGSEQWETLARQWPTLDLPGQEEEDSQAWIESAALVRALDLVITVDTAVAHLAGALGVPVWVALPFSGDWRWLLEREDSPWYPSMRLFRQGQPGDWPDVFQRIRSALPTSFLNKR